MISFIICDNSMTQMEDNGFCTEIHSWSFDQRGGEFPGQTYAYRAIDYITEHVSVQLPPLVPAVLALSLHPLASEEGRRFCGSTSLLFNVFALGHDIVNPEIQFDTLTISLAESARRTVLETPR
jgi:hypothetical protein